MCLCSCACGNAPRFQNGLTLAYICFYLLVPGTHICYFAHMGVML